MKPFQPKQFYRKFDALLRKIDFVHTDKNFLFMILSEFYRKFGRSIYISSWRIFEGRKDGFVLVGPPKAVKGQRQRPKLSAQDPVIQKVSKQRTYILDDTDAPLAHNHSIRSDGAAQAALLLRSREKQWIVVFELAEGWVREEILFCMNAVRAAVNHRLLSDVVDVDVKQATEIQLSLLPRHAPALPWLQIAARSQPAQYVGGDLYDFFEFDDGALGLSIGDASGHGLAAALLVRDLVTGLRMGLAQNRQMNETIETLNQVIYRGTFSSRFISLFYGEFEKTGEIRFVNAGHPAPLLVSETDVLELTNTGTILGAFPEISLHCSTARLDPGNVLVGFTDGIYERRNKRKQVFSIAKLKELVVKYQSKSPDEILDMIFRRVFDFGAGENWNDDATVVVVKRTE